MRASRAAAAASGVALLILTVALFAGSAGDLLPGMPRVPETVAVRAVLSGTVVETAQLPDGNGGHATRLAAAGDDVNAGDAVAAVTTTLGEAIAARTPISGRVSSVSVRPGQVIRVGQIVCIIRAAGRRH